MRPDLVHKPCAALCAGQAGGFPGDHLRKTSHCALDALFNVLYAHMPQSRQSRKVSERGHTERCATACESLTGDLKRLGKRRHTQWCCTLPAASCVGMRREVSARAPASHVMKWLFGAGGSEIPSQARSAKQHSCLDYRLARVEIQCLGTPPLETSSSGRAWKRTLWRRRVQPGTPQCLLEGS